MSNLFDQLKFHLPKEVRGILDKSAIHAIAAEAITPQGIQR